MPTTTVQSATLLKTGQGIIRTVSICVVGSADGMICDAASVGMASAANAVFGLTSVQARSDSPLPPINFASGIVVKPGTGQTVCVN